MSADVPAYGTPPTPPPASPEFDFGKAFGWGWQKFRANTSTLLLATLLPLIAVVVMYVAAVVMVFAVVDHPTLTLTDSETGDLTHVGSYFATLGVAELTIFVLAIPLSVLGAGLIRVGLLIADGGSPGLGEMFRIPKPWRVMLTSTMISVGTVVGLLLCYLPGIAFGLLSTFAIIFVIDRGEKPIEALKSSFTLVKSNFGSVVLASILGGVFAGVGILVCIVGALVTIPVGMLIHVYTYRFVSGGAISA